MCKVFIVWERESAEDYDVVLITKNEETAKTLSGEQNPCDWSSKTNYETDRYYEMKYMEMEYHPFS